MEPEADAAARQFVLFLTTLLSAIAAGMVGAMMFIAAGLLLLVAFIFFFLMLERARSSLSRTLREMETGPAPA
ncbi:MAG: hypothetical protein EA376_09080 [Phycisphaeraceae bacterium]|nr:MAG: hypothetical protein EA376_09080 [Phycisphaeraceae bacterium]